MDKLTKLILKATEYFSGDAKRIQHFIKVYTFSKIIADGEGLDEKTTYILLTASVVHDMGIRIAEEKFGKGHCGGKLQEKYGPDVARNVLEELDFEEDITKRVCFLVGHHHTYEGVDGQDWQILLEADFLVNAYEDKLSAESVKNFRNKIFRTETGEELLNNMFGL
ncbi:MAG: HD domain-containing protein [Oscillospiraceae bacterium]